MQKKYYKILQIALISLLFTRTAVATKDAKPLGLELGKTTIEQFKAKYYQKQEEIGFSPYTKGYYYRVPPSLLPLEHIEQALFFFNHKNKLVLVHLNFENWRFNQLKNKLSGKYKLIKEDGMNVPILGTVGKQLVEYVQGNTKIELSVEDNTSDCSLKYTMIKDPEQEKKLTPDEQKDLL